MSSCLVLALGACGVTTTSPLPPDASTRDASALDASATDASAIDAALSMDSGPVGDASAGDAGTTTPAPSIPPAGWTKRWPPPNAVACESTAGAPSGVVYPTAVAVRGTRVFVGTNCGQLFRSDDAGVTWAPIPAPPSSSVPAGNSAKLWVSEIVTSGTDVFASFLGPGVFVTHDDGATWSDFNAGLPTMGMKVVMDLELVGNTLVAALFFDGGVYATPASGASWTPQNMHAPSGVPADGTYVATCPNALGYQDLMGNPLPFEAGYSLAHDATYLYYGNKCGGVFRAPLSAFPGGATFTQFDTGLPFFGSYYQDPYAVFVDGSFLWVGVDDEGAYRSPRGGSPSFVLASTGETVNAGAVSVATADPIAFTRVGAFLVVGDRFGGLHAVDTTLPAYSNASATSLPWIDLGVGIGNGADTVFEIAFDPDHLFVAAESGLYVSH